MIEKTQARQQEQLDFFVRTNQPPHEGVVFEGHLLEGREVAESRFLLVDEDVYHIGASLKDLGKRLFAFDKMGLSKDLILSQVR